jgi:hypothetical protein
VKIVNRRTIAVAALLALVLVLGGLAQTSPTSAAGPSTKPPTNAFNYPNVMGVSGSSGAIESLGLNTSQVFRINSQNEPWLTASGVAGVSAYWTFAAIHNIYAQVSGQYCKDKSGGDVFVNAGAPAANGLTC